MPCNFLVKFDGETNYEHVIIETCNNSNPPMCAVHHFTKNNKGLRPREFSEYTGSSKVWVVSVQGVAIFEELYQIHTGEVAILKDHTKEPTSDNLTKGLGWKASKIEGSVKLLPGLGAYVRR